MSKQPQITAAKIVFLSLSALALTACGHMKSKLKPNGGLANTKAEGGMLGAARIPDAPSYSESLNQEVHGVKLKNKDFDIPVVYNKEVDHWVSYFLGSGRKYFSIYLERMGQMQPIIAPKLKSANAPQDLIFLAMIESGFSTQAKSRASAVGPWQFMKATGRLYDLEVNWWVDERRDPAKSTEAAIRYLKTLHDEFGSWELATAAYNSGERRIRRAISSLGTKDFWTIARNRRALRRETKDYVPKMMAAAIVAKNAEQFGFEKPKTDPFWAETELVKIPKPTNLKTIAKVVGVDRETMQDLNPELGHCCTPPAHADYMVRVPKGAGVVKIAEAVKNNELGNMADFNRHVIRKGESLSRIASRYHVPADAILSLNEIRSVKQLKIGSELLVPVGGARVAKVSREIASEKPVRHRVVATTARHSAGKNHVMYTVRKGDTLYEISRRYAVRVEDIKDWNYIGRTKSLRPGRRLKLYVKNEQPKS